jgi:hypothetical protein
MEYFPGLGDVGKLAGSVGVEPNGPSVYRTRAGEPAAPAGGLSDHLRLNGFEVVILVFGGFALVEDVFNVVDAAVDLGDEFAKFIDQIIKCLDVVFEFSPISSEIFGRLFFRNELRIDRLDNVFEAPYVNGHI